MWNRTTSPWPRRGPLAFAALCLGAAAAVAPAQEPPATAPVGHAPLAVPVTAGPTRVTLDVAGATVDDAFDALGRAARCRFELAPGVRDTGVTLRLADVPVLQALDRLCDATGTAPAADASRSGPRTIAVGEGPVPDPPDAAAATRPTTTPATRLPRAYAGPFALAVTSVVRENSRILDDRPPAPAVTVIRLTVRAEPGVLVLTPLHRLDVEELADDRGHVARGLRPSSQVLGDNARIPRPGLAAWVMEAKLPYDGDGRTLRLKAAIRVVAADAFESVRVPIDEAAGLSRTVGGVRVEVVSVAPADDGYAVGVRLTRAGCDPRAWPMAVQALLATGPVLLPDGDEPPLARDAERDPGAPPAGDTAVALYRFPRGPGAARAGTLAWDLPVSSRVVTVPFELVDVPLP